LDLREKNLLQTEYILFKKVVGSHFFATGGGHSMRRNSTDDQFFGGEQMTVNGEELNG
jgi:hypothetical protein